jgi:phosphoribosylaminoimidazole-succinocarboxamide synthase
LDTSTTTKTQRIWFTLSAAQKQRNNSLCKQRINRALNARKAQSETGSNKGYNNVMPYLIYCNAKLCENQTQFIFTCFHKSQKPPQSQ